jgi:hypothetical protein
MISSLVDMLGMAIIMIYAICILPALFFTYIQERLGMKIEDAPNKWLGILYHFLTVWVVMPLFFYRLVTKNRK